MYFIKMFSLYTVIVSCMLQLLLFKFNLLTTSNLLQITEFGTSYFKVFRKIVSMPKQLSLYLTIITVIWTQNLITYFIVLTLLNVRLDVNISVLHYICYKHTPLENHCLKAKVLLTLHTLIYKVSTLVFYKFHLVWSAVMSKSQIVAFPSLAYYISDFLKKMWRGHYSTVTHVTNYAKKLILHFFEMSAFEAE